MIQMISDASKFSVGLEQGSPNGGHILFGPQTKKNKNLYYLCSIGL